MQNLKVFRLHPDAALPRRALLESIGYDIEAHLKTEGNRPSHRIIGPQCTVSIPTGLCILPPDGYCLLVCSRSGMASSGIVVANAPGVIDPDYTGEVRVLLCNSGWETHHVKDGDRIAQILVIPRPLTPSIEVLNILPRTERGAAGFGSTGR